MSRSITARARALLAACVLLVAGGASAAVFIPARPVAAELPPVPPGGGGWVYVTFVVQADGSVADVLIVDSSGAPAVEKAVADAIAGWKFAPATLDGKPVPQRLDDRLLVLRPAPDSARTGRRREKERARLDQLIDSGELDAAELGLVRQRDEPDLSYPEWAAIHLLLARVAAARGDQPAQLDALVEALPYQPLWDVPLTLRSIFALQMQLQMYRAAMGTYILLKQLGPAVSNPEIERVAGELRVFIDSRKGFRVPAEIRRRGSGLGRWRYDILRRRIAFADVQGVIDRFEVRCATHTFADKVDTEREWTLPVGWGNCILVVIGQPGTRFTFLELPDAW